MKRLIVLLAAATALGVSGQSLAQLVVIANPATSVAPEDIREIYLGDKQFQGGAKLAPVDNAALQERFLARVLNMSVTRYQSLWTKKAFREGLTAPALKSGDAEVAEFVRQTPGAIGYVVNAPADVRVVKRY